jgi:hypothetical protein
MPDPIAAVKIDNDRSCLMIQAYTPAGAVSLA